MNKLILSLAAFSLLLSSCGNSTNEKSNNQTEVAEHNEHHHDDESEAIELNNGEKWIDLVKELSEAKDETEAEKQFQSIQTSFTTFNQYFQ